MYISIYCRLSIYLSIYLSIFLCPSTPVSRVMCNIIERSDQGRNSVILRGGGAQVFIKRGIIHRIHGLCPNVNVLRLYRAPLSSPPPPLPCCAPGSDIRNTWPNQIRLKLHYLSVYSVFQQQPVVYLSINIYLMVYLSIISTL